MSPPSDLFVVSEDSTIEKDFGWVFFYNSQKYRDTGILRYTLAGNGPVVFDRYTGAIEFFGTSEPVEKLIDDYERRSTRR